MEDQELRVYSHKVLLQLAQHMLSDDILIEPQDYKVLRLVFRHKGGSWQKVFSGDPASIELLKQVVSTWGQMPDRKHKSDMVL